MGRPGGPRGRTPPARRTVTSRSSTPSSGTSASSPRPVAPERWLFFEFLNISFFEIHFFKSKRRAVCHSCHGFAVLVPNGSQFVIQQGATNPCGPAARPAGDADNTGEAEAPAQGVRNNPSPPHKCQLKGLWPKSALRLFPLPYFLLFSNWRQRLIFMEDFLQCTQLITN